MGNCRYCNTKVGLFKNEHETCTQNAESARRGLRKLITDAISSNTNAEEIKPELKSIKEMGRLSEEDARTVLLRAADDATLKLAHLNPVSVEEADRIGEIFKSVDEQWFSDPSKLVNWSGFLSLLHSSTLYQVLHGESPYFDPAAFAAFRFINGETPILKRNAVLAVYRSISAGNNYHSVSVPIGGGMYYRVGASHPRAQQTGLVPVDEGLMIITTQAIYFSSHETNFRLPYSSIIRIESFVDGIGVYENHGSGKVFIPGLLGTMDEGWYFYNLVSALMKW